MLSDCALLDLNYAGAHYTWCNQRLGDDHVKERIDRAVGNVEFREAFQSALVMHVEPVGSDHHMIAVDCEFKHAWTQRSFKFEAVWLEHEDYLQTVEKGWLQCNVLGRDKVEELVCRLENCKESSLNGEGDPFLMLVR
ncbi:uncharacterized protein LOC114742114 [Neltuma alba]|uniref:uncharacterized protein LOC114742114 n=1 Tax=Neltuma alba TaxID=207710 RepID=UPI0010A2EB0F|nr:uncharacterized protein LOC114742114 [Prosopis alba]